MITAKKFLFLIANPAPSSSVPEGDELIEPPTPGAGEVVEKGVYSSAANPPWWNFYFSKTLAEYPVNFTLWIATESYAVTVGTRANGQPGMDGPDGKFYVKQSSVAGRGMAIGIHKSFKTKQVWIVYTP